MRIYEKQVSRERKNAILAGTAVMCLGILFFFKYFNFASESIAEILGLFAIQINPITLKLLLPVGISFYTFQTLSYVIDVYRGDVSAEKHFGYYAAFISFFPQLVAGPIERTSNLLPQIKAKHIFEYNQAMNGARLILWGFFKKLAIADVVSNYVNRAYANLEACTGFDLVAAVFFFTIQIYCDFSGYSDIAIGTAKLFGINLIQNFKSPYFACSLKEFWSRWHISLSTWFRDYVYIPLGGSRCTRVRSYCNLFITFIVSGIWHGANWTFLFWGGLHGLFQVVEKIFKLDKKNATRLTKIGNWLLVFLFCNIAWVYFRADSIHEAFLLFKLLFINAADLATFAHTNIGLTKGICVYLLVVIGIVGLYDYVSLSRDVIDVFWERKRGITIILEYAIVFLILFAMIINVEANQFVYFQF